jgi:hypothetical protein
MAVNPDPKPGRWILPLVILAMIGFTYFFVGALPEASPDTTIVSVGATTTTINESSGTTTPGNGGDPLDPVVQAYLDELDEINAALKVLETEMVTVNAGFDADPREIAYEEAEPRLDQLVTDTEALGDQTSALAVPSGFETNQQALQSAIDFCAGAAEDAVDGLRSTDTGELRQAAVETYTTSASGFDTEVQNAKAAAGT